METNLEIRMAAKKANVKLWQIAEKLGVYDGNFSRCLRRELSTESREFILQIIADLVATGGETNG
jgi:hypothetical protein